MGRGAIKLKGIPAAPGITIGKAYLLDSEEISVRKRRIKKTDISKEIARFKKALAKTKEEALEGADALVICTEWQNFRAPDFDMILERVKSKVIFDGRNIYEPALMNEKGLAYYGIGRSSN